MDRKTRIIKFCCAALIVGVAVALLCGVFNKGNDTRYHVGALTRTDITYVKLEAPQATNKDGTVSAKDWRSAFPYITDTMLATRDNETAEDYLEEDPYLVTIYEGYGFAKDYKAARGHEWTLEDVNNTARPHATANCLTCKTPNFTKLVNDMKAQGEDAYTMSFDQAYQLVQENGNEHVSCYTCHGNNAGNKGELTVVHDYVNDCLGANAAAIDPATLSCGQCHIEYYFQPYGVNEETGKLLYGDTKMPYSGVETMTAEAILAYYDAMELPDGTVGFYDWIQPSTGTRMLKTQHPEMETFLQGVHAQQTIDGRQMNCADCHMPIELAEDGTVYHNHALLSPLENEILLDNCATCHGDANMVQAVHRIQSQIKARETEVGNKLAGLKEALAAAVESGTWTEEELAPIRKLYREAQWFFDYSYVENSEGFHGWMAPKNGQEQDVSNRCLTTAEAKIAEAMALLERQTPET